MKLLLLILLFSKSYGQDTLEFHTIAYDAGVKNYIIQSSVDSINWMQVGQPIKPQKNPDSNVYKYPIETGLYYRVTSQMTSGEIYLTDGNYNNTKPQIGVLPVSTKEEPLIVPLTF